MIKNNNIYLHGDLITDSICFSGEITFQKFEKKETLYNKDLSQLSKNIIAGDLFIDGNIIINSCIYTDEIYQKFKKTTDINPKSLIIKCNNFYIENKIISMDDCIYTTNNNNIVKLRTMKIKKLKLN